MPKKTCQIIVDGGNDYAIAVKGNQKNLHHQIRHNTENTTPTSRYITTEKTRNRTTKRTVEVFHDLTGISQEWVGLKSLIKVERIGHRADKAYRQVAYYISSIVSSATDFAKGIRGHWRIENCLHWVKDVIFDEDHSTIRTGNAPANLSVMRTIALNVLRRNGYSSITSAQRFISNDIDKLLSLVE